MKSMRRINERLVVAMLFLIVPFLIGSVDAFVASQQSKTIASVVIIPNSPISSTLSTSTSLQQELHSATDAIEAFYQGQPYLSAFVTCAIKGGAADAVAQLSQTNNGRVELEKVMTSVRVQQQHHQQSIDLSRSLAFVCYGGIYQGLWQQFMYTKLFPAWLSMLPPDTPEVAQIAYQVTIDQALIGPFLCLPIAYAIKGILTAKNISTIKDIAKHLEHGLDKYWQDCTERGLLFKYWGLWIPVNWLVFSMIPMHLRVVCIAFFSFFWVLILSATAADTSTSATPFKVTARVSS